jgi:hypothetical protein
MQHPTSYEMPRRAKTGISTCGTWSERQYLLYICKNRKGGQLELNDFYRALAIEVLH